MPNVTCITKKNELTMCNTCCKELHGWCRAFTATEVILSILQAILLTLFLAFLTFLILHLIACSDNETYIINSEDIILSTIRPDESSSSREIDDGFGKTWSTISPGILCTWTPSAKTKVVSQYFEHSTSLTEKAVHPDDGWISSDQPDEGNKKSFVMALVKHSNSNDVTFLCILTVVSKYWTLTAASCIQPLEKADSLDEFVMIYNFGEPKHSHTYNITDVLVHPKHQGSNVTYDIGALKSADKLPPTSVQLKLPTLIDYFLITMGERLTILGFGQFRKIEREAPRGMREVSVHALPRKLCGPLGPHGTCAGVLQGRRAACGYCAGTPLLRGAVLLGIMADDAHCGVSCEPSLYVNVAAMKDWLDSVFELSEEE